MSTYKHLKDEIYYDELYDRFTIEECQRRENGGGTKELSSRTDGENLEVIETVKANLDKSIVVPVAPYFIKGERYRNKSETIRKWMERDKAQDEKVAKALEPRGIRCLSCSSLMDCESRDLHIDLDSSKDRVLFFFSCPRCHKKRAYWEGGQEWQPSPHLCEKCGARTESVDSRKGNVITMVYSCFKCGHVEMSTWDLDEKKEEIINPNFESDRKKYCLSEKEGGDYISSAMRLERVTNMMKDREQNKEIYEAAEKIKKLTIVELQNLLNPLTEGAGYIKLELEKPDVTRDVIVEFSLQDNKPSRAEYDSKHDLQKIIKKALEGTNWRLMSEGMSYRLGILSGRLRGIDGEENLRKLVSNELKK